MSVRSSLGAAAVVGLTTIASARTASAVTPLLNVDCQTVGYSFIEAMPINPVQVAGGASPVYAGSVTGAGGLISILQNTPNEDPAVVRFTQSYYDGIEGAANYYYVVRNFDKRDDQRYWVAIPVIDEQSDLAAQSQIGFEPQYPGLPSVRFPRYSSSSYLFQWAYLNPQIWAQSGGLPEGIWVSGPLDPLTGRLDGPPYPFLLRSTDYASLQASLGSTDAADPNVAAQDVTCAVIRDSHGNVIDFTAHLSAWDPKSPCPACLLP